MKATLYPYGHLPEFDKLKFRRTLVSNELSPADTDEWEEYPERYSFETKIDGHQARMYVGYYKPCSVLMSRRVSEVDGLPTMKHQRLPRLREFRPDYQAVFEGELCHPDLALNSSDASTAIAEGFAHFYVWDVLTYHGKTQRPGCTLEQRRELLLRLSANWPAQMRVVPRYRSWREAMEASTEGIVVKGLFDPHTVDWTRIIQVHTEDVFICGYTDSESVSYADKGWIATISFAQYFPDADVVRLGLTPIKLPNMRTKIPGHTACYAGCCSGFDQDTRQAISENRNDYLGSVLTVKCKGLLPTGMMRQPRFDRWRDDKSRSECVRRNNLG